MFKYCFIIFISLFVFCNNTFAQQEVGLHFMDVLQNSKTNPAYVAKEKILIGLPHVHLNYYNTGGAFNKLMLDYLNNETGIVAGDAINNLSETGNVLRGVLEIETLSLGYRFGKIQVGISHAQKTDLFMSYPKSMAKLFFEGNGQFIGQDVALDNQLNLTSYNEFALHGAIELSKLTIGARAKYLTGIANASVSKNELSLFTDSDVYQLTLNTDYQLNVSTLVNTDDLANFNLTLGNYSTSDLFTKNVGIGIDFGVTYQVNEKLKLAASVIDLGKINWTENINNYSSEGSSTYNGFDFSQFANNSSVTFDTAIDTLETVFNFEQTNENYSTTLPTKIYLSGKYQLNQMIQLGGLFYNEIYEGQNFPVFAISGNAKVTKLINAGIVYSGRKDSFLNLGLNFAVKLGPAQIFATTDNILAVANPFEKSNVNVRGGINVLFK